MPIYESLLAAGVVLPLLILVRRRRRTAGEVAAAYAVFYGVIRFVVEMFRGDSLRGMWLGGTVSTSQLISLALVPGGLVVWYRLRARAGAERSEPA